MRSTRNRALNHVRHQRIVARELASATLEPRESLGTDADMLGVELERVAREAIAALPERCREVFELSRVHGMRYVDIAETLEISVKTVEKRMGQALSELRERLAPWLGANRGKPLE
jgi:RNA polymerase sigma-70 factor (ECF subfamily)